jgi:tetratricopeptide (TPR) repeat protein
MLRHMVFVLSLLMAAPGAWGDAEEDCRQLKQNAIAACSTLMEHDPKNMMAYTQRGRAYRDKQDYERAMADIQAAIRLNPQDTDALAAGGEIFMLCRTTTSAPSRTSAKRRTDISWERGTICVRRRITARKTMPRPSMI